MNKTKTVTIKFEIENALFEDCKNSRLSLHEALCKAIHELDADAMNWLQDNVVDVDLG